MLEKECVIMCSCVCTDWGAHRLALWQMYRTSCIIYVCSFSYAQKPDVLSISGSPCHKHVGTRRRKPNNNKQVFSVTNSSHFGTNNKKTFQDFWQREAWKLCFFSRKRENASVFHTLTVFSLCLSVLPSISAWWGRVFLVVVVLHVWFPGVSWSVVLAGWQRALSGLNKQLWHMGRMYSAAPRLSHTAEGMGTCGNVKHNLPV